MDLISQLAQLLLSLSILVTIHELGHYLAARMFGIRVDKFYLFFDAWGVKLFSFKKGDTEYGIGWLPIGGYVKIAGMIDESMDTEQMQGEPQEWEYRSKKPWQKLIVMLGGIIMNIILGITLFICYNFFIAEEYLPVEEVNQVGIYAHPYGQEVGLQTGDKLVAIRHEKHKRYNQYESVLSFFGAPLTIERGGKQMTITLPDSLHHTRSGPRHEQELLFSLSNFPMVIDSIHEKTPAAKAGLKKGDQIVKVNEQPINVYGQFQDYIHYTFVKDTSLIDQYHTVNLDMKVIRDGQEMNFNIPLDSNATIGVGPKIPYETKNYTFGEAVSMGTYDAFNVVRINAIGLKRVFTGQEKATESIAGPIRMAGLFKPSFDWGGFLKITAFLSMILALMNLLPIPALDGGHVVILIIEWIRGKPISDKWMMKIQTVGIILVIGIMLFACGNDIWSLFK